MTLHTVAAGRIDDLVFSFKGIIGEQQRMRIAYTTRRGLKGKAARGARPEAERSATRDSS